MSSRDIIDFLIAPEGARIGVELKLKAQRKAIYRQLCRYAEHEEIHALVLLSGTAMTLPETINGKPAYVFSMGTAWL
ncbi:hypothetical protein VRRI112168_14965 [Vreelandella rituensis]|uniref:Uncharacterized protein n=1 Tax=Vreelandella rituensis TaxID=2282306 RepID=A0A368UAV0_9GAMM|nr:hypothetical protein [Halomonas rituensis]RCV93776.1 hypothetical protein DU506_01065 [Halomonas rituensis]